MPIALTEVGGEFRVTAAGAGLERMLGAKVEAIDGMPIGKAHQLALSLTPSQELPQLREGRVVFYLARGLTLHGLGITRQRDRATYALRDDAGHAFSVEVHGLGTQNAVSMTSFASDTALQYQHKDESFVCQALATHAAVYCSWRAYEELRAKAQGMWTLLGQHPDARLIIDMRDNGGGDNTVGWSELVMPIAKRADLNRKGRLYVLVGPLTFSAAMNNAAQFQDSTRAILVGETIGERPNSYQEPRQFRLPKSHLVVRVSTIYYAFRERGPNAIRPDKEIIPTWTDIRTGHDPVVAWVLRQP